MNSPDPSTNLAESFDDFYETSLNGYLTAAPDGRIIRANSRIAAWLGFDKDELLAMNVADLLSIGGKIYFETHLRPLLRMQAMFDEVALELVSKDGRRMPVLANAFERRDDNSKSLFVRFTFFRAVARKKYEEALRAEREQALEGLSGERTQAVLREQFIAVLGHDLRNPIASIDAGMRMLAKSSLDDKSQNVIALVRTSTARMAGLIDDIMDFARGRLGGGMPVDPHPVLLEPLILQAVNEIRVANPGRLIETTLNASEPFVCDPGRMSQVVSNLLGNAISHGAAHQPIRIEAAAAGDGFELAVMNGGQPIPQQILPNLFTPFTRGSGGNGLGLGLYICAEIARAHGGSLTAASTDEETRFTMTLPRQIPRK